MTKKDYKGDVVAEAWDHTKSEADPPFDAIREVAFKENLAFRAEKVKTTGIATTNFEKEVAKLLAEEPGDDSPMAVVEPPVGVNYEAAAEGQVGDAGPGATDETAPPSQLATVENFSAPSADTVDSLVAGHSRAELEQMAKDKGLDGNSYTNKTELATAILA